jgi:hypothetical protein
MSVQLAREGLPYVRVPGFRLASMDAAAEEVTRRCRAACSLATVGCALSHLDCWRRLARSGESHALIMEDDAVVTRDFVRRLDALMRRVPADHDMVYLGCTAGCNADGSPSIFEMYGKLRGLGYEHRKVNSEVYVPTYPMGLHAYVLTRRGALKLLTGYGRDGGVREAVDVQVLRYGLRAYAAVTKLARQFRSLDVSTIVEATFPRSLNYILDAVRVDEETTLAYVMTDPVCHFGGRAVSPWTITFALLAWILAARGVDVLTVGLLFYAGDYLAALLLTYRPAPRPAAFHAMSRMS